MNGEAVTSGMLMGILAGLLFGGILLFFKKREQGRNVNLMNVRS